MDEDFTLQMFLDNSIVDSASWQEFMPTGVTKAIFKNFIQYYDPEVLLRLDAESELLQKMRMNLSLRSVYGELLSCSLVSKIQIKRQFLHLGGWSICT